MVLINVINIFSNLVVLSFIYVLIIYRLTIRIIKRILVNIEKGLLVFIILIKDKNSVIEKLEIIKLFVRVVLFILN